jgi:hypothetical protein
VCIVRMMNEMMNDSQVQYTLPSYTPLIHSSHTLYTPLIHYMPSSMTISCLRYGSKFCSLGTRTKTPRYQQIAGCRAASQP